MLTAPDERALLAIALRLKLAKVAHVMIHEPDAPWDGQLTAIGVRPERREVLRRHLSSYPLLK